MIALGALLFRQFCWHYGGFCGAKLADFIPLTSALSGVRIGERAGSVESDAIVGESEPFSAEPRH